METNQTPGSDDGFTVETDFPGETLHYIEPHRRTRMTWTWNNGYTVYSDSLEPWQNSDGSRTPLTQAEIEMILNRVVKYALDVQHVKMKVE